MAPLLQGHVTGHHWRYDHHDQEFVDWIEYKLVHDNITIAIFRCEGMGSSNTWECPIFKATKEGGFFSSGDCKVETKAGWDPLLGLMLAHLCSTEYSPNNVKSDFHPAWPSDFHYRWGRDSRPHGNAWYAPEGDERGAEMINGGAYAGGIAIQPEMFQAIPGYVREFYLVPPYVEEAPEAEATEPEKKKKIVIDFSDLQSMPTGPGPVLRAVPAHMETGEDGLLIFVPISFETLEPPGAVERVEEEIEVCLPVSDNEGSDDEK